MLGLPIIISRAYRLSLNVLLLLILVKWLLGVLVVFVLLIILVAFVLVIVFVVLMIFVLLFIIWLEFLFFLIYLIKFIMLPLGVLVSLRVYLLSLFVAPILIFVVARRVWVRLLALVQTCVHCLQVIFRISFLIYVIFIVH